MPSAPPSPPLPLASTSCARAGSTPWTSTATPALNANDLKKRTLTNLYNQRPAWLANAHAALDAAVAAAYGWPANLDAAEILERLLALNLERSG